MPEPASTAPPKVELQALKHLPADGPERKILYEDPEFRFCILAHVYHGAKESAPHDHGPTWAIYGQAMGETVMSDWEMLEPASEGQVGKVRLRRNYTLTPGMAYVYNEGDLHSPRRDGPTRLIRIEGRDVTKIRRYAYEQVAKAKLTPRFLPSIEETPPIAPLLQPLPR